MAKSMMTGTMQCVSITKPVDLSVVCITVQYLNMLKFFNINDTES